MSSSNGSSSIVETVRQIPCGLFVLTSAAGGVRSGVLTRWVQPCSLNPPHVMVAVSRGLPVEPLVRDSRAFALCQISQGDKLLQRRFIDPSGSDEDPFISLPSHTAPSGSPIIDRAMCYLDCELVRHVVLDADYRVYVGLVHAAGILHADARPAVEVAGRLVVAFTNGGESPPLSSSERAG